MNDKNNKSTDPRMDYHDALRMLQSESLRIANMGFMYAAIEASMDWKDQLLKEIKESKEKRMNDMKDQMTEYVCHKHVHAAKITGIKRDGGAMFITFADKPKFDDQSWIEFSPVWMDTHKPEIGGYVVRYKDGYDSYSPAKAFEEGYTLAVSELPGKLELATHGHRCGTCNASWKCDNPACKYQYLVDCNPEVKHHQNAIRADQLTHYPNGGMTKHVVDGLMSPPLNLPLPKPSIGRIVIYHHPGSLDGKFPPRNSPAIIQEVLNGDYCRIFVFGPLGQHMDCVYYGTGPSQWSWPERS